MQKFSTMQRFFVSTDEIARWFIPTFLGDFRLASHEGKTLLTVWRATDLERKQLKEFQAAAQANGWVSEEVDFHGKKTIINAPIGDAAIALASTLKPNRKLVSAIKVADGKLEEVFDLGQVGKGSAVVTVAKPARGCPPTDFEQAEIKASEVLRLFLSAEQQRDFERHNKFVAIGADTGRRYMIASRSARSEIARYERSLYDLDDRRPLCAHDWTVPAAEEMLALLVCVSTRGNETRLRELRPH